MMEDIINTFVKNASVSIEELEEMYTKHHLKFRRKEREPLMLQLHGKFNFST